MIDCGASHGVVPPNALLTERIEFEFSALKTSTLIDVR